MESYNIATIIFFVLFVIRIFVTCCISYYRKNGGCRRKNSYTDNALDGDSARRRLSSDIFVINLNDHSDSRIEVEPPSYDSLTEEIPPPNYEEAVKLPPLTSVSSSETESRAQ